MSKDVQFENENTGGIRKFPDDLFQSILTAVLYTCPKAARETFEKPFSIMLANYLDTDPDAKPIIDLAELYRSAKKLKAFTWIHSPGFASPAHFSPEVIEKKLKFWADRMFARYGNPVYLVGSALTGGGNDVDVRIMLPNHEFEARFPERKGWAQEVGKQGIHATLFARMNIDFQIQSYEEAREFAGKPVYRLDSNAYPEGMEPPAAGIGADS